MGLIPAPKETHRSSNRQPVGIASQRGPNEAATRIHHLSCGTMCPWGGSLTYGPVEDLSLRRLVCHCFLIESPRSGLVLVDTGFGLGDVYRARQRLSRFFLVTNRIQLDDQQPALRQVEKLGYGALDVRHVALTHLDFDHAGGRGLPARDRSRAPQRMVGGQYRAKGLHRPEPLSAEAMGSRRRLAAPRCRGCPLDGLRLRTRHGRPAARDPDGAAGRAHLGHCGVAVQQQGSWLLHVGDADFFRGGRTAAARWASGPTRR